LNEPRIPRLYDRPKSSRIADIAIGIFKLRMVEQIEELRPKLNRRSLSQRDVLKDGKIEIGDTRTTADGARGIADHSQLRRFSETSGIKREMARTARIKLLEWRDPIRFTGCEKSKAVLEFYVGILSDANGESALQNRNSRDGPTFCEFP
jgi:hypothetical protein